MPIIKVTLEPPTVPYPQVQQVLDASAVKAKKKQADAMIVLEKAFNDNLEQSKKDITNLLDRLLKVFSDKTTLKKAINASASSGSSKASSFLQTGEEDIADDSIPDDQDDEDNSLAVEGQESSALQANPAASNALILDHDVDKPPPSNTLMDEFVEEFAAGDDGPVSFVEVGGVMDSVKQKLSNVGAPSLLVQLLDVYIPDASLEAKIVALMNTRDKGVESLFKTGKEMFSEVSRLTLDEIKTNLQIQLNSYTADLDSIKSLLGGSRKSGFLELDSRDLSTAPEETMSQQTTDGPQGDQVADELIEPPFVVERPLSFAGIEPQQLNVAVGTPDIPYPTVADVVHAHLQEREASERLIRSKILQMAQHLMTSQLQILKEELRPRIARAISTVATVSSALQE